MKTLLLLLGAGCALAACTNPEDQLEDSIRNELSSRGNVQQVELTRQDENSLTGFALVDVQGTQNRLNCTANRDPTKGASYYNWRCVRAIDEAAITEIETTIRQSLERQGGRVEQVDMSRRDDDHMTGFAVVNDGYTQIRTECTATRGDDDQGTFNWQCRPAGQDGGAPAENK